MVLGFVVMAVLDWVGALKRYSEEENVPCHCEITKMRTLGTSGE